MSMALDLQAVSDFLKDSNLPKTVGDAFGSARGLPGTQKDIAVLARTAEQVQSPEFQKEFREARSEAETVAMTALALQALSTAAILIVAVNTFKGK